MSVTVTAPKTEVPLDRFNRYLIVPPDGGNPVAYTRASTWADTLDDRYNLELWKLRMAAIGLADRPDLLLLVTAQRDDKEALNATVDLAMEAAKSKAGANTGTAVHKLTELLDQGVELPAMPAETLRDLDAYEQATAPLNVVAIEQHVVLDDLHIAGRFDRIVEIAGHRFVADLKTGAGIDYGAGGIAIQLACYSRGMAYDPATHTRTPLDVNQDYALVIWLPQGQGRCELRWINIDLGWEAALLAHRVRKFRRFARTGLLHPFDHLIPSST